MRALSAPAALAALALAAAASVAVALAVGSAEVGWSDLLRAPTGERDGTAMAVLLDVRLPRVLAGLVVGALLALAGAVLQALLRNPLADPYVLGISGGAALGSLTAILLGAAQLLVQASGVAGALAVLAVLFVIARRALFVRTGVPIDDTAAVLLSGVMLAALASAGIGLLLALAPDGRLRPMMYWLLGDLSAATDLSPVAAAAVVLVLVLAAGLRDARGLNVMLGGDVQAFAQGVDVASLRRRLVLLAALGTAAAVNLAGAVGFVGFVTPHVVRRVVGNDQRVLLPACALAGGALVVLADTVARTVAAPLQLPVGALTALIGVPAFLLVMRRA